MRRWIDLEGAVNVRDLGGLPTIDGEVTVAGRVARADNLQDLTDADVALLVGELSVRRIVDLRSNTEVTLEGAGPLTQLSEVNIYHLNVFPETDKNTRAEAIDSKRALPWQEENARDEGTEESRLVSQYCGFLRNRPDSIIAALRVLAQADGMGLVHCAAGKDRTGVVVALALSVAGVTREAIVEDYIMTGERLTAILRRLRGSNTYRSDLDSRLDSHVPRAEIMEDFLDQVDHRFGGVINWLSSQGWTSADTASLHARLCR